MIFAHRNKHSFLGILVLAGMATSARAIVISEGDAIVADAGSSAATAAIVDCVGSTGNRTVITGNGVGSGAALDTPEFVTVTPTGAIYYYEALASGTAASIISVNAATGARTVVSGPAQGTGVGFIAVSGMAWDAVTSALIVSDSGSSPFSSGIISVDPATGNRTFITGNGAGSGAVLSNPQFVAVGGDGTIYYYETSASGTAKGVVSVNPANGVRTLVSGGSVPLGTGSAFIAVTGMAWDPTTSTLIVADAGLSTATDGVIRVVPSTGQRAFITLNGTPTGPALDIPLYAGVLLHGNVLYVEEDASGAANSVVGIIASTGNRILFSGSGTGTGPAFVSPSGMTAAVLQPIIVNPTLTASGISGRVFTGYAILAADAPASYSATGLPSGLSVNTSTGQISGTPTKQGKYTVTLGATNALGTSTATLVITVVANPGDFNGDGNPDIYWTNTSTGDRGVYLMNGTTRTGWADLGIISTDWRIAAVADFAGNGQSDILWQNTVTGECGFYIMSGTHSTGWVELGTVAPEWRIVGAGEFENDGNNDIVWQDTVTGVCGIYTMNKTTVTGWVEIGTAPSGWQIAGIGDFNGDGFPDIVWQNPSTGECGFYTMSGTNITGWVLLGFVSTDWRIAAIGDFNGDGMPDILWQNSVSGDCGFYIMNGTQMTSWVDLGTVATVWQIQP